MADQPIFVRGRLSPRNLELLRRLLAALFALLTRVEASGMERLPDSGGFILAPNHLSRFDAPLVFSLLPGRRPTAFAADTYRTNLFFRLVIECVDAIWVRRGAITPTTMKAALQALRAGRLLGLAPEGTRSGTRALRRGRTGTAFLAVATGVPVVPAAITGTERIWECWLRLRRPRLTVTFGEPFTLAPPQRGERAEQLEAHTTEIMCRIAALLPPEYRGVYAHHPRLQALLGEVTAV